MIKTKNGLQVYNPYRKYLGWQCDKFSHSLQTKKYYIFLLILELPGKAFAESPDTHQNNAFKTALD